MLKTYTFAVTVSAAKLHCDSLLLNEEWRWRWW